MIFILYAISYTICIYIVYLCILYFKKQKQILKSKGLPLHLLSFLEAISILYICKYKLTCLGYFHIETSLPTNNLANTTACKNNLIWLIMWPELVNTIFMTPLAGDVKYHYCSKCFLFSLIVCHDLQLNEHFIAVCKWSYHVMSSYCFKSPYFTTNELFLSYNHMSQ